MDVGTISTLTRAIFVLFVVLVPAQCQFKNAYTWNVTCDLSFLMIRFRFEEPFKGVVYAEDHKYQPACSFRPHPTSNLSEVTLKIDSSSCGTETRITPFSGITLNINIRIQQHNILETQKDITQAVVCSIPDAEKARESDFLDFSDFSMSSKTVKLLPKIPSKLEIKQGYAALGPKLALERKLFYKSLLVFSVPNSGVIKDIHIKNCFLHDTMVLDKYSLFFQITHPSGCQNASTKYVSAFEVVNSTETGRLVAYAQITPIRSDLPDRSALLSCAAQLCKRTCKHKCPRKSKSDVITSLATHIISKRSTNGTSDLSTRKPSDAGNRFIKSTIKLLSRKFLQQAKAQNDTNFEQQPKAWNATDFEKRVLHGSPKEIPAIIGIPAYSVKNSDEEYTNSSRDYDLGMYGNTDNMGQLEEEDNEDSSTPGNTAHTTPRWSDSQNRSPRSNMTKLIAKMDDLSEILKQRELFDGGETYEEGYGDSEEIEKSNDYNETLTDEPTEFEITNIETFNLSALLNNSFQDTTLVSNDSKKDTADLKSTEESGGNCSGNCRNNKSLELDFESSSNDFCVSQLTFVIVTILLGFVIFTLMLVTCGMVLYIKKEKKRHLIDNFLLYSFY